MRTSVAIPPRSLEAAAREAYASGVTSFELEPDGWREVRCEHCGGHSTLLDGYVHAASGAAIAAYRSGWTSEHHPRQVLMRLVVGPIGREPRPGDAWLCVGLRAFFDGDRIALAFDEHELAADAEVPPLGHDEVLEHPRVEELWAMADAVWERDARLAPAGHWLLEGVPANLDRA